MPSSALFIDDAPRGAYTFTVQTSPKRQHAWILTSEPMDGPTYTDLAKRAAYHDADRSGWDVEQLVRLPGTFNTKRCTNSAQWWAVTMHPADNRTFTLDELRRRWPAVATVAAQPSSLDAEQVDFFYTNVKLLLNSWGYPKRLKLSSPGIDVLKQGERVTDRSKARYSVAKSLYVHGYPDAEIAALLLHFCDYGQSKEKGSAWLDGDIARIIGEKLRPFYPNVTQSPTRIDVEMQPARPRPVIERVRVANGRPRKLTADELLAFYQGNTAGRIDGYRAVPMRKKEVAAELHISLRTLRTVEGHLLLRGEAERITPANRQSSYVILLKDAEKGSAKTPNNASLRGHAKTPTDDVQGIAVFSIPMPQNKNSDDAIGEHTPATRPGTPMDVLSAPYRPAAPPSVPAPVPVPGSGVCSPPSPVFDLDALLTPFAQKKLAKYGDPSRPAPTMAPRADGERLARLTHACNTLYGPPPPPTSAPPPPTAPPAADPPTPQGYTDPLQKPGAICQPWRHASRGLADRLKALKAKGD